MMRIMSIQYTRSILDVTVSGGWCAAAKAGVSVRSKMFACVRVSEWEKFRLVPVERLWSLVSCPLMRNQTT